MGQGWKDSLSLWGRRENDLFLNRKNMGKCRVIHRPLKTLLQMRQKCLHANREYTARKESMHTVYWRTFKEPLRVFSYYAKRHESVYISVNKGGRYANTVSSANCESSNLRTFCKCSNLRICDLSTIYFLRFAN
jgi:hypothetical protein